MGVGIESQRAKALNLESFVNWFINNHKKTQNTVDVMWNSVKMQTGRPSSTVELVLFIEPYKEGLQQRMFVFVHFYFIYWTKRIFLELLIIIYWPPSKMILEPPLTPVANQLIVCNLVLWLGRTAGHIDCQLLSGVWNRIRLTGFQDLFAQCHLYTPPVTVRGSFVEEALCCDSVR